MKMSSENEIYLDKNLNNNDTSYYHNSKYLNQNITQQGNEYRKIISASEGFYNNVEHHDKPQQLDAVMYVVVVLAVYTSAIVILFVRYMHKGRDRDHGESTYYTSSYYKNYISKSDSGNNASSRMYIDNPQIENKERLKTTEDVLKKLYGDNWMESNSSNAKQAVTNAICVSNVVSTLLTALDDDKKSTDSLLSSADDESSCKKQPPIQQNPQQNCTQLNSCCKNDKHVPSLSDINNSSYTDMQTKGAVMYWADLDRDTYNTTYITSHLLHCVQQKEYILQDSLDQGELANSNSSMSSHNICDRVKSDSEFNKYLDDECNQNYTCGDLGDKGNLKLQSSDSGFISQTSSAVELRCEKT